MSSPMRGASIGRAVCLVQLGILVLAAGLTGSFLGKPQALAALYGGLVAMLPTAYFALRLFGRRANGNPADAVGAFYIGEVGKFALTVLLFGVGVKLFAEQFLPLIATYGACLLAYWLVLAWLSVRSN